MINREFLPIMGEAIPDGYAPWRIDASGRQWVRRTHPPIQGVPRPDAGPHDCEIVSRDADELERYSDHAESISDILDEIDETLSQCEGDDQ